uniref:SWIM-type domain-containing protein n=1 Tax=Mesocestoides corti TaxID=53468 RepID=A0A5K3FFD0_MESCO
MVGCHNTPSTGTPPTTAPFNRSASLQEQVARALQANFLLLHQPAPNAFIVLDPSPVNACQWDTSTAAPPATGKRHRFRVTLGGHSPGCTCSEQPLICPASTRSPCAHTLFVLLRVLRLKLEDPRIARPRLENYEVEPLLQRYARLRASNFRASGASRHQDSTTTSAGTATNPAARIFMPRPVVLSAVGPNPCLLAAVRASVGSSECSELSSITRSIEPASRGVAGHADAIPVCRRCLSHASSSSCGGDGGGGGVGGGGGCGAAERAEGSEGDDSCGGTFRFDRRPKTEPQAYYETLGSRIEMLNSTSARHALSTTFRPIGEPSSNPETDPETEGVSSSSRSSRFEEAQGGVVRGTSVGPCGTASSAADDTLTGLPRRSASPDGMESSVYHPVCRLCLRELARVAEGSTTVCASVDCVASFHQACFLIWQDECETETGSLYCPVCGRVWTTALTPTNPPDDARKLQAPRCAEDAHCVASSWAPGVAIVSTRLAPSNGDNIFLHSHVIPGLKDSLDDWKSAFSEEVAMGIISPYWHVRQSALRQVAKITICRVLMARRSPSITFHQSEGSTPNKLGPESLRMSFRLIQYFLSDPADEVFIASLVRLLLCCAHL